MLLNVRSSRLQAGYNAAWLKEAEQMFVTLTRKPFLFVLAAISLQEAHGQHLSSEYMQPGRKLSLQQVGYQFYFHLGASDIALLWRLFSKL